MANCHMFAIFLFINSASELTYILRPKPPGDPEFAKAALKPTHEDAKNRDLLPVIGSPAGSNSCAVDEVRIRIYMRVQGYSSIGDLGNR